VRRFAMRHRLALWLIVLAVVAVALFVVFFVAGQGGVSGGAS